MSARRFEKKTWFTFFFIPAVLIFLDVVMWYNFFNEKGKEKAVKGQVKVEATITSVHISTTGSVASGSFYDLDYEYLDKETGIRYSGVITTGYTDKSKEKAYTKVGNKVAIYIDGEGHSILVGKKPDPLLYIILGSIFALGFAIMVSAEIYVIFFKKPKAEKQTKLDETDDK